MKPFQIIVISIFMLLAVSGVLVFALSGQNNQNVLPKAVVWGTVDPGDVQKLTSLVNTNGAVVDVQYEYHDANRIDNDFVNALAEGRGPDVIIFPDDKFLSYKNKLYQIPYANFPERTYVDSFVDAAGIFLGKDGVWAVPFSIDPLVMYWNKAIFNDAGLALPPKKWSDLADLAPKIIEKSAVGGVSRALVAMGEYRNIKNAKDIIASLIFQVNNPISSSGADRENIQYVVNNQTNQIGDAVKIVEYYTSFSNPTSPMYSWNRSFPSSDEVFTSGDLALYFGMASELNSLRVKNPNLYFDVAPMLQRDDTSKGGAKATLYSFGLVKSSKNLAGAFAVVNYLTNASSQKSWSEITGLPPARRDLLSTPPNDPFQAIFYKSAIQSQTWLDPNPNLSNGAFQDMIESVTSGKQKPIQVVSPFSDRLLNIYYNK